MRDAWACGGAAILTPLLLVGFSMLAMACEATPAAPEAKRGTKSNFSVLPVDASTSILPALESTQGKPNVCVALLGFDDASMNDAMDRTRSMIRDASSKWNALLRGNPDWSVTAIEPNLHYQVEECRTQDGADFNVNVWATVDRFKSEFCESRGFGICASAALPKLKTFFTGPWNRDQQVDALDPFTMLHEYGHLLGLGDTYRIQGVNDWEGEQPASVMNGLSQELTQDDQLGLWVALRALKTGVRSCDGFGTDHAMTANGWDAVMCDPNSAPTMTHEGRPSGF
jgi:hypothetical protein